MTTTEPAPFAPLLEATTTIAAPPEAVWAVVSDPRVMGGLSEQAMRTVVRGTKPVGVGTRTINLNRRGALIWPTRAKVIDFDPPKRYAYAIAENSVVWSFDLEQVPEGTRVTHRRETPRGMSDASLKLQRAVLGGVEPFEGEMSTGMQRTLERLREVVESR